VIKAIIEEHESEEDDEEDEDEEGSFNQYSETLEAEIVNRIKRDKLAEKGNMITEDRLAMARGDNV